MDATKNHIILSLLFLIVSLYVVFQLNGAGFYQNHFFEQGFPVVLYQLQRAWLIVVIAWISYATGDSLLRLCRLVDFRQHYDLGYSVLAFLAGGALLHLFFFVVGLAGLYSAANALYFTLLVLLLSLRKLAYVVRALLSGIANIRCNDVAVLAVIVSALVLLLIKGLYPAGGHDYYNHYFQFYRIVTQEGVIKPNDVWYHFFNSKGAAMYFYAILLSDLLAPQLVTIAYVYCGAAIVYLIVRPYFKSHLVPCLGAALYLLLYTYTPGPVANMKHGGWGDFEKLHELTAVFILGIMYCLQCVIENRFRDHKPFWCVLVLSLIVMSILNFFLTLMVGGMLGVLMMCLLWRRQYKNAVRIVLVGSLAGVSLVAVLAINYYYTGMFLDNVGVIWGWKWFDLQRLQHWAMVEVLMSNIAYTAFKDTPYHLTLETPWAIITFLRLEIWWPIYGWAMVGMMMGRKKYRPSDDTTLAVEGHRKKSYLVFMSLAMITVLFALAPASQNTAGLISGYRMFSFNYGPSLIVGLMLCSTIHESCLKRLRILIYVMSAGLILVFAGHTYREPIRAIVGNSVRLMAGNYSLRDAYSNQAGWPGRLPWGGIFPGMEEIYKIVPRGSRIFSFVVNGYCMLPDCRVEGWMSYRFSSNWQTAYFGKPEKIRDLLQADGINYFFFTTYMIGVQSLIPKQSSLFTVDNISKYLAIRWSDGKSYLLTWPGKDTRPIDDAFLQLYKKGVEECTVCNSFPEKDMRTIANTLNDPRYDGKSFPLPWHSK